MSMSHKHATDRFGNAIEQTVIMDDSVADALVNRFEGIIKNITYRR